MNEDESQRFLLEVNKVSDVQQLWNRIADYHQHRTGSNRSLAQQLWLNCKQTPAQSITEHVANYSKAYHMIRRQNSLSSLQVLTTSVSRLIHWHPQSILILRSITWRIVFLFSKLRKPGSSATSTSALKLWRAQKPGLLTTSANAETLATVTGANVQDTLKTCATTRKIVSHGVLKHFQATATPATHVATCKRIAW